jgi:oligopeptidase B
MKGISMPRFFRILTLGVLAGSLLYAQPQPPKPVKIPKIFREYGKVRADEYFWMNDSRDSAVIAHLVAENAYTSAMLKQTEQLRAKLYNELIARIEQRYESLPAGQNGYWYYIRYEKGKQYPLYCRKKGSMQAPEEVSLDANALARGHQILLVRGLDYSPDNTLLAYAIDTSGDRRSRLFVKRLVSSTLLPEVIPNTSGNVVWANDGRMFFYVVNDATVRAYRVMRHVLGTPVAEDREVFTEADSTFQVRLSRSRDRRYIFITSGSTLRTEVQFLQGDQPTRPPVVIQPRLPDLEYSVVDHADGDLYILTNQNAKNFRLVKTPVAGPGVEHWVEVIAPRTDALLEGAAILKRYVVAQQRINALPQILVIDRAANASHYVDFQEGAYVTWFSLATDAYDLDSIRFSYSSLTTPLTDYRYELSSRKRFFLKREKVGGMYDQKLYETKRLWTEASDGTRVPLTVVYKKALFRGDGTNPALLYAYGSYGASTDPGFNRSIVSLLDRGFIYGIAHVRGGQELGRQWYEEGKVMNKKNTFTDFIACASYLVQERYTAADRLFANGASAGGMLMGAVTNMRPDLFRGILAEVPWMDVITDMFNTDLPETTLEFDEWGNPAIKSHYDYMITWSPYDQVRPARYPAIFATGGLNDTQVPYFSPAKWVARVRDNNTGLNPVLFKCNMGAGHGGESGRFERQKLIAMKYAFMLDLLGIKN